MRPAPTEGFAALCEHAAEHGVRVAIEFLPWSAVPDLATTWQIVRGSGTTNGGIVIDMLHWQRQPGGPNLELLRQIPAIGCTTCRCATPAGWAGRR